MKTEEDALNFIITVLKEAPGKHQWGGYGVYIPSMIRFYMKDYLKLHDSQMSQKERELSPLFYSAAWRLCLRGILRPGIKMMGAQATPNCNAGDGYSITPFGYSWIEEVDDWNFIPTESGRFIQLIKKFVERFGVGFAERAQEANTCYNAHAYLACCVMSGAAVESILLALAIAKDGDEEHVLKMYGGKGGRSKIKQIVINTKEGNQRKANVREIFQRGSDLLEYWRDESAHGQKSDIYEVEAYTSLLMLLRFAQFCFDNWEILQQ